MSLAPPPRPAPRSKLLAKAALGALLVACPSASCGDDTVACPESTEPMTEREIDLYRQLEVCVGRVLGTTIHREELPRVEKAPELVACDKNPTGQCVTTPAGQPVTGYYIPECDVFTVALREVIYHEAVHAILADVPGNDGDPGHRSPAWQECQQIKLCPDQRLILAERVCDGTADCSGGEDEKDCL